MVKYKYKKRGIFMLTKKETTKRNQVKMVCIEELVPNNHILRKIEAAMDFSFIYDEVKELYCLDNGRPSIDPVVLIKLVMIECLFGLNSMRRTIRECEVNMAYKWFLGYDIDEKVPHFSTFGKNYVRRFEGTDIFEKIFERILKEAINSGFVNTETIFIDGTHIKANANTKNNYKETVKKQAKSYHKQLIKEINKDRTEHNKKPFDDDNDGNGKTKTVIQTKSKTDPESGLFHKGEHKRCFAYTAHTSCDKNNFVLDVVVSSGNVHDSVKFDSLFEKLKSKYNNIKAIVVDAGYKTPHICKQIIDSNMMPVMPYKRPMGKKGFFRKNDFVYDEYYDCYLCPENQVLKYSTTNKEGYREYKSQCDICKNCPRLKNCTQSKNTTKIVIRHVWEDYIEKAEDIRHTYYGKQIYSLRSQTIERVFADAKEKYGMRYTQVKGINRVKNKVLMTFACMNLKKLTKFKQKYGLLKGLLSTFFIKIINSIKISKKSCIYTKTVSVV